MEEKKPRISNEEAALMTATAVVCDLLGPFGAVGGPVVFFIWFKTRGISVISKKQVGKQAANLGLNALGEGITAGVWAGVTVGVILTIAFSRAEDTLGVSLGAKALENPGGLAQKAKGGGGLPGGAVPRAANDNVPHPSGRPQMRDIRGPSAPPGDLSGVPEPTTPSPKTRTPERRAA
ncbi:MAG TPA: hypothetical protein VJ837_00115 [Candidatus Paceibacterota bacterium]|nr:hypothetical protein [Candidatus Paceibacterota bacterium]